MIYTEIEFQRIVTANEDGSKTVSFTRTSTPPKQRNITEQEAQMLNAGKLTSPGNIRFTYLLKEDEADPQPQTLQTSISSGPGASEARVSEKTYGSPFFPKPRTGRL